MAIPASPQISRFAFEQQLKMLGFVDTGEVSDDGLTKAWRKPDKTIVILSNKPSIPSYMLSKLLLELGFDGLNLYGGPQD